MEIPNTNSQKEAIKPQQDDSPSLLVKIIAIVLGTGGALLVAYFGYWVFDKLKSITYRALNEGMPLPSELPPALQNMSPVIWQEAKRLTKATAELH